MPNKTERIRGKRQIYSGLLNKNSSPNTNEIKRLLWRMQRTKLSAFRDNSMSRALLDKISTQTKTNFYPKSTS